MAYGGLWARIIANLSPEGRWDVNTGKCYEHQSTILNNVPDKNGLWGQTGPSGFLGESLGAGEYKLPTSRDAKTQPLEATL